MAHAGGRPLKFKSVEEFEQKAAEYFANTPEDEWLITGLALYLDTFRDVLMDYERRDEFSNAVKRAKLKVESSYEKSLRKNGRAGDIFGLKNFGWRDKTEQDITSKGEAISQPVSNDTLTAFISSVKNDTKQK